MNILFAVNHPAQYHLFKHSFYALKNEGHKVMFVIRDKDILEKLMLADQQPYVRLITKRVGKGFLSVLSKGAVDILLQESRLFTYCRRHRPDLMVGTDYCITHVGKLLNIPSIVFNEDDFYINRIFCSLAYPFATYIVSPNVCDVGKYTQKKIGYDGYQKLAYLHPSVFTPEQRVAEKYFTETRNYVLIRLVSFSAGHDVEQHHTGIDEIILNKIIQCCELRGFKIYISSEAPIPLKFVKYELKANVQDMHHIMSFASLFIGDSQSMIVEAAMLGTPSIRFNSFVGKISVLNELEEKYKLTTGIHTSQPGKLLKELDEMLVSDDLKSLYQKRRLQMLEDKIDVSGFITWLLSGFPVSLSEMNNNKDSFKKIKKNDNPSIPL